MRKVCVVTGTRADYGLLSGLMRELKNDSDFELQVVASCMHLSSDFGYTYREIEQDGFYIDAKIDMLVSGDTPASVTKSIAFGVSKFTDAFSLLVPDLVVILGDRFEALAAAQTAMMLSFPIAHIHGGEITEGSVDESIRHAITKMSHLHFVSTSEFEKRVVQMGELPSRVFVSGALGIDNIKNMSPISRKACEKLLNFSLSDKNFLVTYHPVTIPTAPDSGVDNLLLALEKYPEVNLIVTFPNADAGGRVIINKLKKFSDANPERVLFVESLGHKRYLKTLQHMDCVIGNSSSGLIEAPSFNIPIINIGDRQKGRTRALAVIDCDDSADSIVQAIETSLSEEFKSMVEKSINPYGQGNAAEIIIETLKKIDFDQLLRKPFLDVKYGVDI